MFEDRIYGFLLHVGWVAVPGEGAANEDHEFGPGAFADRPVDGGVGADFFSYLSCNKS